MQYSQDAENLCKFFPSFFITSNFDIPLVSTNNYAMALNPAERLCILLAQKGFDPKLCHHQKLQIK